VQEKPWEPTEGDLQRYAGRYYSAEFEAYYGVAVKDQKLVLTHRRYPDQPLNAGKIDHFKAGFPIAELIFVRGEDGNIKGFTGSNGRTRGVVFDKVE